MSDRIAPESHRRTITIVALGYWSAALTNGALRVIVPVYFASAGVSISKIAFLFFLFKFAEIFAPMGIGLMLNRWGYKRTFITGLAVHSMISALYLFPSLLLIYVERFVRGLLYMADISAVYVKHFSPRENQRFLINMMLGLKEASKGVGMIGGGLLIAILTLENTLLIFAVFTGISALVAVRCLPDLKEQVKLPVLKIWGTVDKKIKNLGLGFGLLNGALDAWGVVVLPIYLTTVLGVSPAFVGAVMMAEYIVQGVIVTLFSKYMSIRWNPRTLLVLNGLLLLPVCLALSLPLPLYAFLTLILIYMVFFSVSMVYYNQLMLDFASEEKTSLDLATYTTLTNVFKPIAVFASGLLAESMGFSWAYYFASLLILFSALTCLALPKSVSPVAAEVGRSYGELAALKKQL
ncbi:MAG TPA: MFS transporter [Candidatus Binatia bacterium]|nr:MFS transporter [Candidatus Binatia bacterium]